MNPKIHKLVPRADGATAARLTPDQKVGSSNLSALMFLHLSNFRNYAHETVKFCKWHPNTSPSFLGQFDPTSPKQKRLCSEMVVPNFKKNEKETSAFGNGGSEFEK